MIEGAIHPVSPTMRHMKILPIFLFAVCAAHAATLPDTRPEAVGLSGERLERIHQIVERHMQAGDITGAVMLVARRGRIAYVDITGTLDLAGTMPMQRDTVFRLASMTKPVIGTAIMMMLEEGRLQLSDPISKYIPEFANQRVAIAEELDSDGTSPTFHTVPAERDITIRDLLTHTSGLSSGPMGR